MIEFTGHNYDSRWINPLTLISVEDDSIASIPYTVLIFSGNRKITVRERYDVVLERLRDWFRRSGYWWSPKFAPTPEDPVSSSSSSSTSTTSTTTFTGARQNSV